MHEQDELKQLVKEKYSGIAERSAQNCSSSCCGGGDDAAKIDNLMAEDYRQVAGYNPDADLGLGCGLPTQFAKIQKGDTVIDLGSGAGNDCFIARHECGPEGKVIGIDFSEAMITRARQNVDKHGYNNVEFRQGDLENMPVGNNVADVIVSNCVLNLVPNKPAVFSEIFRVLKPGGHFSISDIVLEGALPPILRQAAELYAGCVSGAIQKAEYLDLIRNSGFKSIQVQKDKAIELPEDLLSQFLSPAEMEAYQQSHVGIYSITVYAEKPANSSGCCN